MRLKLQASAYRQLARAAHGRQGHLRGRFAGGDLPKHEERVARKFYDVTTVAPYY